MRDVRTILIELLGRETVGKAGKSAAGGLNAMGAAADDSAKDVRRLDRAVADTEKSIAKLKAQARDSDDPLSFMKDINRQERNLRGLTKLLGDAGDDAALGFSAKFAGRIGPLMARAPVSPPLIAAAAIAAPTISAIVSAAVAGGAAVGAVGLGAALASRRTEVSKAFTGVGEEILDGLTVDAGVMAKPLVEAAERGRAAFRKIRPDLQAVFVDAARYVAPLSRGAVGALEELAEGFRDVVNEAQPIVDVLEYQLPAAGRATSNALRGITSESESSAQGLSALFSVLNLSIEGVGASMYGLNQAFKYTSVPLIALNDLLTESDRKQAAAAAAAEKLAEAERKKARAMHTSAAEIEGMNQALSAAPSEALAAEQANLRQAQSWDELRDAMREARHDGKLTEEEFNSLYGSALDYAGSVQTAAEETRKQTGSQSAANAVLDRGRTNFLAAAKAAGIEAKAAQDLANKLFGIPGQRTTKFNVNKQQAEKDIAAINRQANSAARTRYLSIIARYTKPSQSGALGAVGQIPREKGGPVRRGEAYIVGERRPEVFVPNQNGLIYPSINRFNGMAGGAPAASTAQLVIRSGGSRLDDLLVEVLMRALRTRSDLRLAVRQA